MSLEIELIISFAIIGLGGVGLTAFVIWVYAHQNEPGNAACK